MDKKVVAIVVYATVVFGLTACSEPSEAPSKVTVEKTIKARPAAGLSISGRTDFYHPSVKWNTDFKSLKSPYKDAANQGSAVTFKCFLILFTAHKRAIEDKG